MASYALDLPSSHSSPAPAHRVSPETAEAFRPRSATVGQNPSASFNALKARMDASEGYAKPRPPRLDLTVAREMYPPRLNTEQASYPVPVETGRVNHTLLPTYLAQSYSPIALHNSDAAPGMPGSLSSRYVRP